MGLGLQEQPSASFLRGDRCVVRTSTETLPSVLGLECSTVALETKGQWPAMPFLGHNTHPQGGQHSQELPAAGYFPAFQQMAQETSSVPQLGQTGGELPRP